MNVKTICDVQEFLSQRPEFKAQIVQIDNRGILIIVPFNSDKNE